MGKSSDYKLGKQHGNQDRKDGSYGSFRGSPRYKDNDAGQRGSRDYDKGYADGKNNK